MKTLSVIFFIVMGVIISYAQQQPEQQVTIKEGQQYTLAIQESNGSYLKMTQKVTEFINEFFKQGLTPTGPLYGIYFNSPENIEVEEIRWAIGFPIDKDTAVKEPLKKMDLSYPKAAVYLHVGPYDKLPESYKKVFQYIKDNGYKIVYPVFEKYLDDPMLVKPDKLRTEICVPVTK
jgi:AraC family transcriptional regulator